jgi:hypothetical protein
MVRTERLELTHAHPIIPEAPKYLGACVNIRPNLFPECSQLSEGLTRQNGQAAHTTRFMLTHQKEVIKVISFFESP